MTSPVALSSSEIDRFLVRHGLPGGYRDLIERQLLPLSEWVLDQLSDVDAFLLGVNGAQGTGKTTLAAFLKLALETSRAARVAVLSIDDFYLTKDERWTLAQAEHPLFATRGVPGTHDVAMLQDCLETLEALEPGERLRLPRFDKAADDRAPADAWAVIEGPVDLIVLEGWCVGSPPQAESALREPINDLERLGDIDGRWRHYVNRRLATDYARLFAGLDALVFLEAPDFDAVYRWRLEQERKLAASAAGDAAIMDEAGVAAFIRYFERLTRHNLDVLAERADVTLTFDADHRCIASTLSSVRA